MKYTLVSWCNYGFYVRRNSNEVFLQVTYLPFQQSSYSVLRPEEAAELGRQLIEASQPPKELLAIPELIPLTPALEKLKVELAAGLRFDKYWDLYEEYNQAL